MMPGGRSGLNEASKLKWNLNETEVIQVGQPANLDSIVEMVLDGVGRSCKHTVSARGLDINGRYPGDDGRWGAFGQIHLVHGLTQRSEIEPQSYMHCSHPDWTTIVYFMGSYF